MRLDGSQKLYGCFGKRNVTRLAAKPAPIFRSSNPLHGHDTDIVISTSQLTGCLSVLQSVQCHLCFNIPSTHVTVFLLAIHDLWFLQLDLNNSGMVLNTHRESLPKCPSEFEKDTIFLYFMSHHFARFTLCCL